MARAQQTVTVTVWLPGWVAALVAFLRALLFVLPAEIACALLELIRPRLSRLLRAHMHTSIAGHPRSTRGQRVCNAWTMACRFCGAVPIPERSVCPECAVELGFAGLEQDEHLGEEPMEVRRHG